MPKISCRRCAFVARLIVPLLQKRARHFAAQARRERDQSPAVLRQQIVVHARLVVEAFEESRRHQLDQVAVAFVVLAEKYQVVRPLRLRPAIFAIVRRDVHFAADDRLHALACGLVIKICRRKKIPVVGDGHGGHPAPRRFFHKFLDPASPVEKRVIRMQM